ncbi:hypothetical protein [Anthocerotibacter panamensis]|uniref:hypothetical protein n=1 Tax=Anthocerotibacter panamensis TaxID=2857077 RepID=UPI001C401F4B|nr:hypothetical protein [Anthocerotibacter panamensis]
MPTLEDVYAKFGFASEAAQLLETELGTRLFLAGAIEAGLFESSDSGKATELLMFVNRQTLGQLLKSLGRTNDSIDQLEDVLKEALRQRNRLSHSFYRQHNWRRNSEEGRAVMMDDLETIHDSILVAYKAVMRLSGIDLDAVTLERLPTGHLPI